MNSQEDWGTPPSRLLEFDTSQQAGIIDMYTSATPAEPVGSWLIVHVKPRRYDGPIAPMEGWWALYGPDRLLSATARLGDPQIDYTVHAVEAVLDHPGLVRRAASYRFRVGDLGDPQIDYTKEHNDA